MKIAMVSEHASPLAAVGNHDSGGQNIHVAALADALAQRGHDVVVYTRRDAPDVPDRVTMSSGAVVEHLTAGPAEAIEKDNMFPCMREMAEQLARRFRVDPPALVHAHFWMSGHASMLATSGTQIPVVQTFHALGCVKRRHLGSADTSPPQRARIERALAQGSSRIIATCSDEVAELVNLGAAPSRVDIVPCGVDTDLFTPSGAVAARSRGQRLLTVGRLVERKGVDDVISALPMLPDAELVIAGGLPSNQLHDDEDIARLRRRATELGVESRVRFLGQISHDALPELIRSADAVLCTPWYEPFGIVPLEAMACGTPVIGTAVGGLLDTIVDGVTGHLVPPHRPDLIARRAAEMLAQPAAHKRRLGRAGVSRVHELYGWPTIGAQTEDSYLRTLDTTRWGDTTRSGDTTRWGADTESPAEKAG